MQITCKFSGGLSAQPSNLPPVSARNLEKTVNRNGSLKEFSREDGAEGVAAISLWRLQGVTIFFERFWRQDSFKHNF